MISTGQRLKPLVQSADRAEDGLLKTALDQALSVKRALRDALIRVAPPPRVITADAVNMGLSVRNPAALAREAPAEDTAVSNPQCVVSYDGHFKKTTLLATATVHRPLEFMAPILDPRSWGCGGTIIGATFIVSVKDGIYSAGHEHGKAQLGHSWTRNRTQLLYEYARSEFASFENILKIKRFTHDPHEVRADYELHECLVFMLGLLSTPGGLTMNQGHVIGSRSPVRPDWTDIEVLKEIRVRDLTPNDPGNPYDFGQAVNSTMGAALSSWIDDARFLRPVF
jgi:hypothetical protein